MMSVKRPRILGAGLVALDVVVSADPEQPLRGWAGGTCGNVLSILASLGWEAFPIARMNGDAASVRVRADLQRWGVRLELASCGPTANMPIVIQEIRRSSSGRPTHRFSWSCPHCGKWLPSFKPVTRTAVEQVLPYVDGTSVFFLDRVSRGTLTLAQAAAQGGAVIMFEPSGRSDPKLFQEALALAHIVKYAGQRMSKEIIAEGSKDNLILEVQTLGASGLRYRSFGGRRAGAWRVLEATPTESLVDACGSGDWCTAGLVSRLATGGLSSLQAATTKQITEALTYGQDLAAWNCGFEGARGGMYAQTERDSPMARIAYEPPICPSTPGSVVDTITPIQCPQCEVE